MTRNINDIIVIKDLKRRLFEIEYENHEMQYELAIARSKCNDDDVKENIQSAIERSFAITKIGS